jgi:hypothetical protein
MSLSSALTERRWEDVAETAPNLQTVGLTPASKVAGPSISPDAMDKYSVHVFAWDHNTNVAYWEFRVLARRIGSGLANGIMPQIVHSNSLGAATWTVVLSFDGNGDLIATVTGSLGLTVDWFVTNDDPVGTVGPFVP